MKFMTTKDLYDYVVEHVNVTDNDYTKKRQKVSTVSFSLLDDDAKQAILDKANDNLADKIAEAFSTAVSDYISDFNIKPLNLQL